MNLPAPFHEHGDHLSIDLPGARILFTTRRGGVSNGPYATLNLGRFTDDDREAVERNRAIVEQLVGVRLVFARQVHGTRVVRRLGSRENATEPLEADGQATSAAGIAPMVLVADCLPVAVAAPGAVAMLHAGWRGLAGGVIAEGVRAVRELSSADTLTAAIGPGAGPCCYEVGDQVRAAFDDRGDRVWQGRHLDLKEIARQELEKAGITRIHDVGLCTICSDPSLFFSHRREGGVTGRQAGIAWLG